MSNPMRVYSSPIHVTSPYREVRTMEKDNKEKKESSGKSEKERKRSDRCCFYVMDPCGEYYLSEGCCVSPVRYC